MKLKFHLFLSLIFISGFFANAQKPIPFKRIEVTTGVSENGYTEVILPEGFNRNSKVVINGAYDLLSKMNNVEEEE